MRGPALSRARATVLLVVLVWSAPGRADPPDPVADGSPGAVADRSPDAVTDGSSDAADGSPGAADGSAFEGVEEYPVWGLRTGRLAPVLAASTDRIAVDDYTAEAKRLADLLSEVEGVSVRRFGGPGDRSELSIRGSSPSQVVVTVDGIRANSVLTGGLDLSRLCVPLLESVEVTRGAGSVGEGSGAIGGVVNLVSRGGDVRRTTRASVEGGAFETVGGSLLHADRRGRFDYAVGYCGFETQGDFEFQRPVFQSDDGFETSFTPDSATRLNNDREQHGANLGLGVELGPGTLRFLDIASYGSGGEPGVDSGPGPTAGQQTQARSRDLSNLAQLRWEGASPTGWGDALEVALFHRFERERFRNPQVPLGEPIDVDTRLQAFGLRAGDVWTARLATVPLETRLDLDVTHESIRSNDRSGRDRPAVAGALEERIGLLDDRVELSVGGRVDWTDGFDAQLLPSVGLVIEPLAWLRLRAQAGRAYRAPSFDELFHPDEGFIRGNPDLSPEDAWNVDGGLELELARLGPFSNVRLRGTGFYREIDESIVWVLIDLRTIAPINTGSATTRGFEASASIDWTRYLRLSANHTYTDSERDATGESLSGVPDHETFARLRLGPEEARKLVGEVQRTGEILVNEGGSYRLPSRVVWNASASLNLAALPFLPLDRLAREIWIYAALDNISDESVRDAVSFPQPGRNGRAGLEVRW